MSQLRQWLNPRTSAAKMAVVFCIVSVVHYAALGWTKDILPLVGERVIHELTLWMLVTYTMLFHREPMSFIFGVLILVSIGGALERHWGPRRLWIFGFGVAVIAGVFTVALSLVFPVMGGHGYVGANTIVSSMWIAYGLLMGRGQTNFWGLPVTGNTLALIGAAFVLLSGLLGGWLGVIPELVGLVLTFLHVRLGFPQDALQRFGSWRLQRDLNKRSSHLRVISGDQRNTPRDSDKFLH